MSYPKTYDEWNAVTRPFLRGKTIREVEETIFNAGRDAMRELVLEMLERSRQEGLFDRNHVADRVILKSMVGKL